jgi:prevent-host-death family protein
MKVLPLSEVKAHLSALVEEATRTHERVSITRHGRPAAVLLAADDLEALEETLFWATQPGIAEALAEADALALEDDGTRDDTAELKELMARRLATEA